MPTILRFRKFRIVVYPHDHTPAHVHTIGPDSAGIFILHCFSGPVELRENIDTPLHHLRALSDFLNANLDVLCKAWEAIHGDRAGV